MTSILSHIRFLNKETTVRIANNIIQTHTGHPKLRNCQIALTFACNHNCRFCSSSLLIDKNKKYLTLKEWMDVFDDLYELGVTHIDVTGGEPTLMPISFITTLLSYMTRHNDVIVSIPTNGKLVTPSDMSEYKKHGLNTIIFNLQSINQEVHDYQVRDEGNFDKIMSLIPEARRIGLNIGINTCLGTYNFDEIKKLAQWCENEDIILCVNLAAPTGSLTNQEVRISEFKDDYYKFLKTYKSARSDTSFNFRGANLCPGGIEKIYITAYGEVMQCTFCQISFGNVREQQLKEIYNKFCTHPLIKKRSICKHTFDTEFREQWIQPIINNPNPPIKLENHPNHEKFR